MPDGSQQSATARKLLGLAGDGSLGAFAARCDDRTEVHLVDTEGAGGSVQPVRRALGAEGEQRRQVRRTAGFERGGSIGEEGLGEQESGARPDARQQFGAARRQRIDARDAELGEQAAELVFDDIGQRTDDQQLLGRFVAHLGHQRSEASVFALGERRLDARTRIVENADVGGMGDIQSLRRLRQVELDDFAGARTDEEQQLDLGAAGQQLVDDLVKLLVGVGQTGQVALLDDRGAEARLGEHHDARGRLQQMGAGAAADDEEEGVLDLAVQPDDAGQAAKHLALTALAQNGEVARGRSRGQGNAHAASAPFGAVPLPCRRAARSFRMNWPALMT